MRTPSALDQLLLELVNRTRTDPAGELVRLTGDDADPAVKLALAAFGTDLDALARALTATGPVAPLAWSPVLAASATARTIVMVDADDAAAPSDAPLDARVDAFGKATWAALAESAFTEAESPIHAHAAHVLDWGPGPGGVWQPAGNRLAMLSPDYAEVGFGTAEPRGERDLGPLVVTRHYGRREDAPAMLTGVILDDRDGDAFYDLGEGLGAVRILATGTAGRFETTSAESGGYALALPDGDYTVEVSGGALGAVFRTSVSIGSENVKLDIAAEDVRAPATRIEGGPGASTLDGSAGPDVIVDRHGDTVADGGGGADRIVTGSGHDHLRGGSGTDVIKSAGGNDVIEAGDDADVVLSGEGDDVIWGGGGGDVLKAGPGADTVRAGAGDDVVFGWRGADTIRGGPGDDTLRGDFDDDRLEGGPGDDRILGGPGRDVFVFAFGFGEDRVLDYNPYLETLDFTGHGLVRGMEDLKITEVAGHVEILTLEGSRLVLADVAIERLDADDFVF